MQDGQKFNYNLIKVQLRLISHHMPNLTCQKAISNFNLLRGRNLTMYQQAGFISRLGKVSYLGHYDA